MNTVFEIRSALQWSQSKLADEIGVSFATVNRWENEKSTPNRLAQEKMLAICEENHITLAEIIHDAIIGDATEISAMHPNKMVLYHGSKSGIQGKSNQPVVTAVTSELDFIWELIRSSRLR